MEYRLEQEELYSLIEPVISGMGFCIVDLNSGVVQRRLNVHLVLYKEGGITLDDCASVHRTVMPRIEMSMENRDVYLEVGSPGLSRNIKAADEFEVFKGRGVRILMEDENEWFGGIIGEIADKKLELLEINEAGEKALKESLPVKNIRKAKLDDTQEIGR